MDEHVGLVHQRQRAGAAARRPPEGVPHDPLHAVRRVEADLGGDLVRRALAHDAAVADVRALGALADHDEVDVAGLSSPSGDGHAGVEPGGAQVDVVVEGEPQPEQQPALEHAAGHRRVADGAEQDRVVAAQLVEHAVRQRLAGGVPAARAEVVLGGLELDAGGAGDRVEDAHALGDDLRPDAVAGDQRQAQRAGGRRVGHAQWPVSPPLSRRSMLAGPPVTACLDCGDGRVSRCVRVISGSSVVAWRASAGLRDGEPALLAGPAAAAKYEDVPHHASTVGRVPPDLSRQLSAGSRMLDATGSVGEVHLAGAVGADLADDLVEHLGRGSAGRPSSRPARAPPLASRLTCMPAMFTPASPRIRPTVPTMPGRSS